MTMLYLFLSLFASQLFFVTPLVIGKEQAENGEEPSPFELNKTLSESTDPKTPPMFRHGMKEQEAPAKASSFQDFQAEYPDAHAERTKRNIQPKKPEQEDNGCRKVDLIVHTKDFGSSTKSVRPEIFNAYQCKGKCSLTPQKKFINNSLLKAFLKKKKGVKTDGEACCVPTKLRPMSFVYYVEERGSFTMSTYQDMIVEECGCY
ncbi:hypothetical protein ACROYT_G016727 [Oculina patagonica]